MKLYKTDTDRPPLFGRLDSLPYSTIPISLPYSAVPIVLPWLLPLPHHRYPIILPLTYNITYRPLPRYPRTSSSKISSQLSIFLKATPRPTLGIASNKPGLDSLFYNRNRVPYPLPLPVFYSWFSYLNFLLL